MELLNSLLYSAIHFILHNVDEIMSFIVRRTLRGFMILFSWFVVPYSRIKCLKVPRKKLPPLRNDLLHIPAIELAYMIRTKQIKSETIVQAYIDRCNEVNPFINAIVESRFDEALEEARAVDEIIAKNLKTVEEMAIETPLLGVPITVKESIGVKDMSNQSGQSYKKKRIAKQDAPSVVQVKKSGGIILLVSNTPELCMMWETYNSVTGQTRNPHDLHRTPGGSSGGEAALLGAGASLLGMTSDIGGSARLPAMFTGVWGHKPTPYVVSPEGHVPGSPATNWGDFFTIAPMTRYAVDLPLFLKCMTDPNGPPLKLDTLVDIKSINYFYMDNDGPCGLTRPLCADFKNAINKVAQYFNAQKTHIELLKWSFDISVTAMLRIENIETIYEQSPDGESNKKFSKEFGKYLIGRSDNMFSSILIGPLQSIVKKLPKSRLQKLEKIANDLKNHFNSLLGTNGVFIYPTFPTPAHRHYQVYHKLVDNSYMMVFNTLGMPVTNCMIGFDKNNLPIGIQIVANPGQDHLTLAVAKELEKVYGGWMLPVEQN